MSNITCMFAVCCSASQCVAVWCSVLQCVAVCCSASQCVAVWYSVLQCVAVLGLDSAESCIGRSTYKEASYF